MTRLLSAVAFLTILPAKAKVEPDPSKMAGTAAFFPLIGLILGAILVFVDQAAGIVLPDAPRSALVVVALAVLTGGLHLDGLADTFDGLAPGRTADERLAIMKDPRVGTFGTLAMIASLGLKYTLILSLGSVGRIEVLLAFPVLGRWAVLSPMAVWPDARQAVTLPRQHAGTPHEHTSSPQEHTRGPHEHTSSPHAEEYRSLNLAFAGRVGAAPFLLWGLAAIAAGGSILGARIALMAAAAALGSLGVGYVAARRLGGITGDTLGAALEISEVLALLAAVAW